MKIRNGFVSNSSSSSFVVIDLDKAYIKDYSEYGDRHELTIPNDLINPKYEFSWEVVNYTRFEDKICWAYLQALYIAEELNTNKYIEMIHEVLKKNLRVDKVTLRLGTAYSLKNYPELSLIDGFIDHGSAYPELDLGNLQIFDDEENLTQFLFNDYSYISNCNDNGDERADPPRKPKLPDPKVKIAAKEVVRNIEEEIIENFLQSDLMKQTILIIRKDKNIVFSEAMNKAKKEIENQELDSQLFDEANSKSRDELIEFYIKTKKENQIGADKL